jgi:O-antigen ligase/tetratricopeptide (TPR) repeat protein
VPAVTAIFLVAALVLAVVIGPQTRPWTWGPALLALGFSVTAALPVFWRKGRFTADFGLVALGTITAAWFAWRAWISPVAELGEADLLLLAGAVGSFISIRAIEGNAAAERILIWGVALLLLANVVVVGKQVIDPSFTPVFRSRAAGFPSGFYAQYNEAANYLIASSLLVAGAALFGRQGLPTRILWGLIAIAGLAAVYFTRSRGGILGAGVGGGVFAAAALAIAQRRKTRWFAPALIAIPIIGLAIGGFLLTGWEDSQELRRAGSGIDGIFDNNCRLYFLGVALSCIGLHPLAGGGSRSFSWESFRFADKSLQGDIATHIPEQVHNEWLQAATDYGIIGAGLLTGLLGTLAIVALIRILFPGPSREAGAGDAWRLGGLAALAGMFVQSCFSFVFHLLPGILLLGICLGQLSRAAATPAGISKRGGSQILISLAALACAILLLPTGWKGTRVTQILWPSYLGKVAATSSEARVEALTEAIRRWPQATFYQERAFVFQEAAAAGAGPKTQAAAEQAIRDFETAGLLHPYDPSPVVNRANLLSHLHRDAEAEAAYNRAIQLQGGMEPAFRSRFSLANHLLRKSIRQFNPQDPSPALASVEIATQQIEEATAQMHWVTPDMRDPRVSIHESLGAAREANGDYQGAMAAYDFAVSLTNGARAHYRAGVLHAKMATTAWNERRPAEALAHFIEAKNRIGRTNELPQGVTPSQRAEYLAYLDRTLTFLKGAKIEPAKLPN